MPPSLTVVQLSSAFCLFLGAFSCGYHIGALNSPKAVITSCPETPTTCIPMSDTEFSLITAALNIGGLPGSLFTSVIVRNIGRHWTIFLSCIAFIFGEVLMTLAGTALNMFLGRVLIGIGSGIVGVVVPLWLMDIGPDERQGAFGSMNQLGTVFGIFVSQSLGVFLSTPERWRIIMAIPIALSLLQIVLIPILPKDKPPEEKTGIKITTLDLFKKREHLRGLALAVAFQTGQQFTGISAVMFFSTPILSKVFPSSASIVTVLISLGNLLVTLMIVRALDKYGFRMILFISSMLSAAALVFLAATLAFGWSILSAVAIITFVAMFGFGLGPVPLLVVPQLVKDDAAASPIQGVALCSNWIFNFTVSATFLSLNSVIGEWIWIGFAADCIFVGFLALIVLERKKKVEDTVVSKPSTSMSQIEDKQEFAGSKA